MLAFISVLISPCVRRGIVISRSAFTASFLFVWMKYISVTESKTELKKRRISKHVCRYNCKVYYLTQRKDCGIRNRSFIVDWPIWSVGWVVGLLIGCLFGWPIDRFGSKIFKWNFLRFYNNACHLVREISDLPPSFIHLAVCLTTGPKPLPKRALHIELPPSNESIISFP
jgi:hypothetical protein